MPISRPTPPPAVSASAATSRLTRAPWIKRLRMSRPKWSVPSRYLTLPPSIQAGGSILSRKVWSIGECGASSGAKTAMTTMTEMMTIGIHGTRAVRRTPAPPRRVSSERQNGRGVSAAAGSALCGRSTTATARLFGTACGPPPS